ncbi:MAG: hypothetical protein JW959_00640 [Pirellulales bacterium]|nr:hypothetical protein [Pirellulales bacterium]
MRRMFSCGTVAMLAILFVIDAHAAPPRSGRGRPGPTPRPAVNRPAHAAPAAATHPHSVPHNAPGAVRYPGRNPVYKVNPNVKPFTPAWYANHPKAWWSTHHYRPLRPVTWTGVSGWIGLKTAPVLYVYNNDGLEETAVYAEEAAEAENPFAAAEEAADGQTEGKETEWYPLGMYSLVPPGNHDGIAMLQLAVGKDGTIRGTYQDVMTDGVYPLSGSVDKKTQKAAWSLDANKEVVYETGLHNLTEPITALVVRFGDQKKQKWTMNRVEVEEPTDE